MSASLTGVPSSAVQLLNITASNGTTLHRHRVLETETVLFNPESSPSGYFTPGTPPSGLFTPGTASSGQMLRGLLATKLPTGQPTSHPSAQPSVKQVLTGVIVQYTITTQNKDMTGLISQLNTAIKSGFFTTHLRNSSKIATLYSQSVLTVDLSPSAQPTPLPTEQPSKSPESISPFDVGQYLNFTLLLIVIICSALGFILFIICFVTLDETNCCVYLADKCCSCCPENCCPKISCPSPFALCRQKSFCSCFQKANHVPKPHKRALVYPHIN